MEVLWKRYIQAYHVWIQTVQKIKIHFIYHTFN